MDPSKTAQTTQQHDTDNPVQKMTEEAKKAFQAHSANPGPAIPKQFNVQEEGTKEERRAKAQEMNK